MTDPGQQPRDDRPVDRQLEEMLADAERTVARLRKELEARGAGAVDIEANAAQHAEIDRLAEHLSRAQVHWGEVRAFFEEAISELLSGRPENLDDLDAAGTRPPSTPDQEGNGHGTT